MYRIGIVKLVKLACGYYNPSEPSYVMLNHSEQFNSTHHSNILISI